MQLLLRARPDPLDPLCGGVLLSPCARKNAGGRSPKPRPGLDSVPLRGPLSLGPLRIFGLNTLSKRIGVFWRPLPPQAFQNPLVKIFFAGSSFLGPGFTFLCRRIPGFV